MKKMKPSNKPTTYWGGNGKFQALADKFQKLVPVSDMCKTQQGELYRALTNLYYDLHNNGFCNDRSGEAAFLMQYAPDAVNAEQKGWLLRNAKNCEYVACGSESASARIMEELVDSVVVFIDEKVPADMQARGDCLETDLSRFDFFVDEDEDDDEDRW